MTMAACSQLAELRRDCRSRGEVFDPKLPPKATIQAVHHELSLVFSGVVKPPKKPIVGSSLPNPSPSNTRSFVHASRRSCDRGCRGKSHVDVSSCHPLSNANRASHAH